MFCHICEETVLDAQAVEHLATAHADLMDEGFETWPDGGLVVIDEALEPDDFSGGAQ